jgi:hypothetical protein
LNEAADGNPNRAIAKCSNQSLYFDFRPTSAAFFHENAKNTEGVKNLPDGRQVLNIEQGILKNEKESKLWCIFIQTNHS